MRIAIGGIATECCTFSPILSREKDFVVQELEDILDDERYPFLKEAEAEIFPTFRARALPGGQVERATYENFKARFLDHLQAALPLDGLYLDMHGAMNVEGMDDAEGDWYASARKVVGQDCLISASYDLHGNLSERILQNLDMLTAYRTAPHVDTLETRSKAFSMLVTCLEQNIRPEKVWIPVPVLVAGERSSTEYEPAASLYAKLGDVDPIPGIMDASILVGYVWADEPRATASIVLTGTDRIVMEREAKKLALEYWKTRDEFGFSVPHGSIKEAIDWALTQDNNCLFISDSGDNPTAGGVGDRVDFLKALLEHKVENAVLGGIADETATMACYAAGLGETVELSLGGSLDKATMPLPLTAKVLFLKETSELRERIAVAQVEGVTVVISHKRRPFHEEADFLALGINPEDYKMIVVKVGYLVPDLKRIAKGIYLALSPGVVDQAIERLPYSRWQRPRFPLDKNFFWYPELK
ncbi:MAG: M81 family metallopeptidase [Trueperaceae bacterium]|nr:M81 family metallopeptidase [Trueperaceae bacterium]